MEYIIKLGEDTTHEDYLKMLRNRELDDMIPIAKSVVEKFKQQFPTVPIDAVQLVINKTDEPTTPIDEIIIKRLPDRSIDEGIFEIDGRKVRLVPGETERHRRDMEHADRVASRLAENETFIQAIAQAIMDAPIKLKQHDTR